MSIIKPVLEHPDLIAYFLGANNYSWVYFRDGAKKLLAKPISYLQTQLPDFIRVHKTVLLNPDFIKSMHQPPRKKMAGKVYLDSGEVFPVSRRRWSDVVEFIQNRQERINNKGVFTEPVIGAITVPINQETKASNPTILLITNNEENARIAEQTIKRKWGDYQLHTLTQSSLLPEMLKQLPQQERPTLLLLDARTLTMERVGTLQRLKADKTLHLIPVILLVLPTDQAVINGYQHQANSVISLPAGYVLFEDIIDRVCHFWLHTVRLPNRQPTHMPLAYQVEN